MITTVLCDTSVVVAWLVDEGTEVSRPARGLVQQAAAGALRLDALDLTFYELGNVIGKARRGTADDVVQALGFLSRVVGEGRPLTSGQRKLAARIAEETGLTYYDAAYVAVARDRRLALATHDRAMLAAGAQRPAEILARLGLA